MSAGGLATAEIQTDLGRKVLELSIQQWGPKKATILIGRDEAFLSAQHKLLQFAQADSPTLISGESGTGKELFARALYLLCSRRRRAFLAINCAQYHDGQLLLSELFGHRKGSFTGAVADRIGVFEEADGGTVFLDEVGELSLTAQAMLLRTLGEGEVIRLGENRPRQVDVRVIAATSRNLKDMIAAGTFREDLYYRLRFLHIVVPPLRGRGEDWRLMLDHYLGRTVEQYHRPKVFSGGALERLSRHPWPGNIRELKSVVDVGFHASDTREIEFEDFGAEIEPQTLAAPSPQAAVPSSTWRRSTTDCFARMVSGGAGFWDVVYRPFMDRELNRAEVRETVARGLQETRGSYKRLLPMFGVSQEEYLKFMDFLRHHRLKPELD